MSDTQIEWTDKTWNPTKGCLKVSDGCKNCYAIRMSSRLQHMRSPLYQGLTKKSGKKLNWTGKVSLDSNALSAPLKWRKPRRIFVNSMSDLFFEQIPTEFIKDVWSVMEEAHWHQFQVLTKRPERMHELLSDRSEFPTLKNVWMGVSVEDGQHLDRIDILRDTPADVRFISFEPLIGSVAGVSLKNIDWAIVGGESGPKSRVMKHAWVDEIQEACERSGTAFFFKQWGGTNKKKTGRVWNEKLWNEFPRSIAQEKYAGV